ncbi:hypothetical protein I307_01865 [Cryptococcus deuterogattii 99/473]|uniref:Uncharacterized protein n=2 Tax=Cryptococcus deuterogattii TaxID=1859096 RepID=A0A0D0UYA4_9TREE|nr:hypothetical protein I309_02492 [Cryptococcus deuterogattii LA55]KIR35278.1 hypothetical protein I352_02547 [Cryptococcus deuterogattii MMRL2647]KIR40311.1 hypothetical protein I313_03635 [Cryptococcus deuterogattii Ram5]KIR72022.1 hypothetical protein I310_04074 [Cryptococcus deuterogattii CA1014]KIR93585.1 hypothetical protein I304_02259 [Cryptococcus deuterogattii CBS 10090]KIR99852.1 hypothetical protein L804_02488 [Cryptococcus deuterogattii 2001/935-1]KIY58552.1 hypothetical protein 
MSSSTVKQRHYSALASRIRTLHVNLAETEGLLEMMTHQLDATSKMGVHCGSQFMAVSRLLDKELKDLMDAATAAEPQSPSAAPSPERSS